MLSLNQFYKGVIIRRYCVQNNIRRAKYVVSYHDGVKCHNDGSPFYDVSILRNKIDLKKCVQKLNEHGFKER